MAEMDYKKLWLQACKAYDTKNPSGCVCNIDPDTDELRSPCGLHKGWLVAAVSDEREACAKVADEQVSDPQYSEYERACTMTAESIAANIRKRSNVAIKRRA